MENETPRSLLLAAMALGAALLTLAVLFLLSLPEAVTLVLALLLIVLASAAVGALVSVLRGGLWLGSEDGRA